MTSTSLHSWGPSRHIPRMMMRRVIFTQALHLVSVIAALVGWACLSTTCAQASQLGKETEDAFKRYVQSSEARMDRELASRNVFLWIDGLSEPERSRAYAAVRNGQVQIERAPEDDPNAPRSIRGGLIHDWTGVAFIRGVSMQQVLTLLQDYDHDSEYYQPQVTKSKLLQRSGNEFRVFLRLDQTHGIKVAFDTEYDIRYQILDAAHAYSRSYSTRIAEVESAGERNEREQPIGNDHGFLWRLYSYWRFYQADGGVYVQCNAISLTRDVPVGLGWLVRPFIDNVPRDSLRFTLDATRKAVLVNLAGPAGSSRVAKQSN